MLKIYTYHSTIYKYSNNITESTNKIYLYPYNDLKQQVVSQSIKISGNPNIYNYLDNYNNRVGFFTLNEPHKKLEIISETEIISKKDEMPKNEMIIPTQWEYLSDFSKNIDILPFLKTKKFIPNIVKKMLEKKNKSKISPLNLAIEVSDFINKKFKYKKGVTNVKTTVEEVWDLKSGVCQDFTNLMIHLCRCLGIPSRYVSGYILAKGVFRGDGATHAWTEVLVPNIGWVGIDPTNNCVVDSHHIRLAVGGNYTECTPVKGFYIGDESQKMEIKVIVDTKKIKANQKNFGDNIELKEKIKTSNDSVNSYRKNLQIIQQQQ